jgi:hypothetical protein
MNIVIIQEAGRHEANKVYREALNLHRSFQKLEGVKSIVWGLNYPNFSVPFSEIEKWADVLLVLENYNFSFLPVNEILKSNKQKVFWSIDSHFTLREHLELCRLLKIDLLLNSTEQYIPSFNGLMKKAAWFPNAYPDDLIFPLKCEKTVDLGFCGSVGRRQEYLDHLNKFNIQKDIMVIGDDMVDRINSYKIHFNRNILDDINFRTFETAGCRTFLLTNYTPNLEKLFKIGEEVVVYEDLNDLDEKISYYLNNENERIKIEIAGYERAKKDHTYFERAKTLLELIKN